MGASDPFLQLVAAMLVFAVPAGLFLLFPAPPRGRLAAVIAAALVGLAASLLVDALASSPADETGTLLDAAFAGAVAAALAVVAAHRLGSLGGAVFAAVWSALVFQPVFAASVGSVPSLVQTVFGAVDYAGVLASHVAAAASLITMSLLPVPPRAIAGNRAPGGLARCLVATALVTLGATAWMLGVERVINEASGRILANAVAGMLLGAVVWIVIARIAGARAAPSGLVAGAMLGWAAVGAGVAFLSPMALGTAAIIGTASGAAVVVRARAGADPSRRLAIGVIVAAAVGGVVLALLADGFGLAATGSIALVIGQLGAVLAVALGSAASGLLCWAAAVGAMVLQERRRGSLHDGHARSTERDTPEGQ